MSPVKVRCYGPQCCRDAITVGLCAAHYLQRQRGRPLSVLNLRQARGPYRDKAATQQEREAQYEADKAKLKQKRLALMPKKLKAAIRRRQHVFRRRVRVLKQRKMFAHLALLMFSGMLRELSGLTGKVCRGRRLRHWSFFEKQEYSPSYHNVIRAYEEDR